MKRFFLFTSILLIGIMPNLLSQKKLTVKPIPNWVEEVSYDKKEKDSGSEQYLLIDRQINTKTKESYSHYAIELLSAEGVQNNSNITIEFDPEYQQLLLHELKIIRDDQQIQVSSKEFKFLELEEDLNRLMYNGIISARIDLRDTRVGDIIEYSYSVKGRNPLLEDFFKYEFYLEYSIDVSKLFVKVISQNQMVLQKYNEAVDPEYNFSSNHHEYKWIKEDVEALYLNSYSYPDWIDPYKRISLTNEKTWEDITNWAIPLYKLDSNEEQKLKNKASEFLSFSAEESNIISIIRFVQDEIRYLGFEQGINGFKPHKPSSVLDQRFGDCKDKSLLLVTLLEYCGVEAFPVLTHLSQGYALSEGAPSPLSFDHCIVGFNYNGNRHYVDPTISNQGGDLFNAYGPEYFYGLPLDQNVNSLDPIKNNIVTIENISETFDLDSINGSAIFKVKSTFTGRRANELRSYFASNDENRIKEDYKNFYAHVYPKIKPEELIFKDENRNESGQIEVLEEYSIDQFWTDNPVNNNEYLASFTPQSLSYYVPDDLPQEDSLPYYLGAPIEYIHETIINLPEEWGVISNDVKVYNEIFDYSSSVLKKENTVILKYRYFQKKEFIPADMLQDIQEDIDKINNDLEYSLTISKNLANLNKDGAINYPFWIIVILGLLTACYLSWLLIFNVDPTAIEKDPLKIGGWLILPAIGLSISPITILVSIFGEDLSEGYSISVWRELWNSGAGETGFTLLIIIIIELLVNIHYVIFIITLIYLFYKQRSSVPYLMVIFYVLNLLIPLIDSVALNYFAEVPFDKDSTKDIIRATIGAFIWIPYFLISDRVNNTFTKRLNPIQKALDH